MSQPQHYTDLIERVHTYLQTMPPATTTTMGEALRAHKQTVSAYISRLRRRGVKIRATAWARVPGGTTWQAIYGLGDQPDAPKPPPGKRMQYARAHNSKWAKAQRGEYDMCPEQAMREEAAKRAALIQPRRDPMISAFYGEATA